MHAYMCVCIIFYLSSQVPTSTIFIIKGSLRLVSKIKTRNVELLLLLYYTKGSMCPFDHVLHVEAIKATRDFSGSVQDKNYRNVFLFPLLPSQSYPKTENTNKILHLIGMQANLSILFLTVHSEPELLCSLPS